MPIKIYADDESKTEVAWLCDDDWDLSAQVSALQAWLGGKGISIPQGHYIADIGFSVRVDAAGGGAAISPEMMRCMADLGISLFLSEYPAGAGATPNERAKA
jgi:hypothetical protein